MKLSMTKGAGMPRTVRQFWAEVEKTKPDPECDECTDKACESCKELAAAMLINAERFA